MSTQADGLPSALSRVAFFEQKAKEISGSDERQGPDKAVASSSTKPSSSPQPQEQGQGQEEGKASNQASHEQQKQPAGSVGSPLSRPRFSTIVAWRRGVASSSPTTGSAANSSSSNTTSRSGSISNSKAESSGTSSPRPSTQQDVSGCDVKTQSQAKAPTQASPAATRTPAASRPNPMSIQDRLAVFGGSREQSAPQASGPRRATFSTVATQARKASAPSAGPAATKGGRASLQPSTATAKAPPVTFSSSSSLAFASNASAGSSSSSFNTATSAVSTSTATTASTPSPTGATTGSSPTPKRAPFSTVPTTGRGASTSSGTSKATAQPAFRKPAAASGISHLLPKDPAVAFLSVTQTGRGRPAQGGNSGSGSSGGGGDGGTDSSRRNTAPQQSLRKPTAGLSNRCSVCSKPVYAMEKVMADGVALHKWCFRCAECNCKVTPGSYASLEGVIYCKPHFKQLFQLRGRYTFNEESAPDVAV